MNSYLGVKEIWQKDSRTFGITWTDNKESTYDVVALRKFCPCAICTDEMTGKRNAANDKIPDTVRPVMIKSVGRYALSIQFNDGHSTGIYTFDSLSKMEN
jgi:DUF971 family protein